VSVKINNGGTCTLVDSDILNKKDVSYELLIIFGRSCTIQSTPCEHWATVKQSFSSTANERRRNWCLSN